jgi:hypothetical protein
MAACSAVSTQPIAAPAAMNGNVRTIHVPGSLDSLIYDSNY